MRFESKEYRKKHNPKSDVLCAYCGDEIISERGGAIDFDSFFILDIPVEDDDVDADYYRFFFCSEEHKQDGYTEIKEERFDCKDPHQPLLHNREDVISDV